MYFVHLQCHDVYLPKEGGFAPFGWNRSQISAYAVLTDTL